MNFPCNISDFVRASFFPVAVSFEKENTRLPKQAPEESTCGSLLQTMGDSKQKQTQEQTVHMPSKSRDLRKA